jgi:hypothetical protein
MLVEDGEDHAARVLQVELARDAADLAESTEQLADLRLHARIRIDDERCEDAFVTETGEDRHLEQIAARPVMTAELTVFLEQQDHGAGRVERRPRDDALAVLEDPLEVGSQQRLDDALLRAEVLVDRRDAHVGGRGDLLERRTRVALPVEQPRGGGEHGLAARKFLA